MLALLCCLIGSALPVLLVTGWIRAKLGRGSSTGLGYVELALACLILAGGVWGTGGASLIQPELGFQCGVYGMGEYVGYKRSDLPLSGEVICSEGTMELVPAWVNPVVFAFLAGMVASPTAAYLARRRERERSRQPGPPEAAS